MADEDAPDGAAGDAGGQLVARTVGGYRPGAGGPGVEFEPTERDRTVIEELAALGYTHAQMCLFIINPETRKPICENTLAKYFAVELEMGLLKANAIVGGVLFRKAAAGDKWAIGFWLTRRGGPQWKETKVEPPTEGEDGIADEVVERARVKLERMLAGRAAIEAETAANAAADAEQAEAVPIEPGAPP